MQTCLHADKHGCMPACLYADKHAALMSSLTLHLDTPPALIFCFSPREAERLELLEEESRRSTVLGMDEDEGDVGTGRISLFSVRG